MVSTRGGLKGKVSVFKAQFYSGVKKQLCISYKHYVASTKSTLKCIHIPTTSKHSQL